MQTQNQMLCVIIFEKEGVIMKYDVVVGEKKYSLCSEDVKLVNITEDISKKIYDMFQEIPFEEKFQDINVANGLSKKEFRQYCAILELANKNIMLDYIVPPTTWFVLFDKKTPIGWFSLRNEKLPQTFLHSGHIGYTIKPSKRKMGYATKGLSQIIQLVKVLGYKKLFVTTDDKNVPSQNLIKKFGFKLCPKNSKQQLATKKVYDKMSQYYLNIK